MLLWHPTASRDARQRLENGCTHYGTAGSKGQERSLIKAREPDCLQNLANVLRLSSAKSQVFYDFCTRYSDFWQDSDFVDPVYTSFEIYPYLIQKQAAK